MKKLILLTAAFLTLTTLTINAQAPVLHYEYEAYMVQTGTNAPVPTLVTVNTLPCTPTWSRAMAGDYGIECDSVFIDGKTMIEYYPSYQTACAASTMVFMNVYVDQMPNKLYFLISNRDFLTIDCQKFWVHIRVYY